MEFRSVEIEHSNPSLGPHEVVTSYTLSLDDTKAEFEEFLRAVTVNRRVSLGEYLRLLSEQPAEAEEVRRAFAPDDLASGATISALKFRRADGETLTLDDLRYYQLDGFRGSRFLALLVEKGYKHQSKPSEFAGLKDDGPELREPDPRELLIEPLIELEDDQG